MELRLNGEVLTNRQQLHAAIAQQLHLPDYYGENLDALWDVLSSWNEPLQIVIENSSCMISSLGSYGEAILQLLQEAQEENGMIGVEYKA